MVYQIVTKTYLDCILLIFKRDRNHNGLSWGQPEWPVIQTKITFFLNQDRVYKMVWTKTLMILWQQKWIRLPFSTKILSQDSNHSLYRAQNCTVNNDWPFPFIAFTTATTTKKLKTSVKSEINECRLTKKEKKWRQVFPPRKKAMLLLFQCRKYLC